MKENVDQLTVCRQEVVIYLPTSSGCSLYLRYEVNALQASRTHGIRSRCANTQSCRHRPTDDNNLEIERELDEKPIIINGPQQL